MSETLPPITAHVPSHYDADKVKSRLSTALQHIVPALFGNDVKLGKLDVIANEDDSEHTPDLSFSIPGKLDGRDGRLLLVSNDTHRQLITSIRNLMGEGFSIIQPWPRLSKDAPNRTNEVVQAERRAQSDLYGVGIDTSVIVLAID